MLGTRSVHLKYFESLCITTHFEIIVVYLTLFFAVIALDFWLHLKHKLHWLAIKETLQVINIYNALQNCFKLYSECSSKVTF